MPPSDDQQEEKKCRFPFQAERAGVKSAAALAIGHHCILTLIIPVLWGKKKNGVE